MERLLLFDLDGTLLRSQGLGRAALDAVLLRCFGWADATEGVDFAGAIDPQILEQVFVRHGRTVGEARAEEAAFFRAYVKEIRALANARARACKALPGVHPMLERLRGEAAILGVLTGNVEGGALAKLEAARIGRFYAVGAFGDEARQRNDLLPLALERANAARAGASLSAREVVVIGDTPRDVAVARAHGARAVGVATGFAPREALEASEPDVLLEDLTDEHAVLEALLGD